MEPVAVLRSQLSVLGQFQNGAEDIFSSLLTFNSPFLTLMLLHALYERLCTAPLNRLPCYGALEVIVTSLLLLLLLFN